MMMKWFLCWIAVAVGAQVGAQWPQALGVLPRLEATVDMSKYSGVKQSASVMYHYNGNGQLLYSDTLHLVLYDQESRRVKYIDFENGKRGSEYNTEYPDRWTEMMCSESKISANQVAKNCSTFEYNDRGQRLYAVSGQIVEGKEYKLNEHFYEYNPKGQCISQCDLCQSDSPYRYTFEYRDTLLTKITQMRKDSTRVSEVHVFDYNSQNQLTKYLKSSVWQGTSTTLEERHYSYQNGVLVSAIEQYEFEKGTQRHYAIQYNSDGQLSEVHKSIGARSAVTQFTYSSGQLVAAETATDFPLLSGASYWFSANAKSFGEPKTLSIEETWRYDKNGNAIAHEMSVDGVMQQTAVVVLEYR